ncbi:MAG: histidine kinase [Holophagaceae bacterium]|nr:histidine kinase [Holophagaceae bacterium]
MNGSSHTSLLGNAQVTHLDKENPTHPWAMYWGGWTLAGLYMASMYLVSVRTGLQMESAFRALGFDLALNYGWGVVSLGTLALVRRFPLHHGNNVKAWTVHAAASLIITCVGIAMMAALVPWFYEAQHPFLVRFWRFAKWYFHYCFLIYYWGLVGLYEGIAVYQRYKDRQLAASQLEAKLSQAQLQALKMQLNPHFLFNTLNAVSALMHSDPSTADRMLLKLGNLLRLNLEQSPEQETSLEQEIAFLEGYLEIEQLRFGDRLRVQIEVPKPLLGAQVPTFVLQPLVENAIKHGLSDRASGGTIHIRARQDGQRLFLEVEDDGSGAPGTHRGTGIGIGTQNTRSRLAQLYGEEHSFELKFPPAGGALAQISLPLSLTKGSPLFQGSLT